MSCPGGCPPPPALRDLLSSPPCKKRGSLVAPLHSQASLSQTSLSSRPPPAGWDPPPSSRITRHPTGAQHYRTPLGPRDHAAGRGPPPLPGGSATARPGLSRLPSRLPLRTGPRTHRLAAHPPGTPPQGAQPRRLQLPAGPAPPPGGTERPAARSLPGTKPRRAGRSARWEMQSSPHGAILGALRAGRSRCGSRGGWRPPPPLSRRGLAHAHMRGAGSWLLLPARG